MLNITYDTDYSKGNRDNAGYKNFCKAIKYNDQDGIKQIRSDLLASGLSQAQVEAKFKSASKSRIANDKPIKKPYINGYGKVKKTR